jgi:octaprenyl-diphosphate synthase
MLLEPIHSLVQVDLDAVSHFITTDLKSDVHFINQVIEYISRGGKRTRPLVVLLAAQAFQPHQQRYIQLAAAVELIHTATLLHDDVVDHSALRRGHETVNAIWGSQASVLVGDFLYSRAFQLIVSLQHWFILNTFADATNLIAEGEVLQLINCHDPETSESTYFEVIQRKTAKLFEVAAVTGAALSTDNPEYLTGMRQYGLNLGIAYQLIDDVLDYTVSAEQTGKNMGNDLAEGKTTLPMIYALRQAAPDQATLLQQAISTGSTQELATIVKIIESTGAIQYTANAAKQYAKQACDALLHIPDSPYRQALYDLAGFVVERNY